MGEPGASHVPGLVRRLQHDLRPGRLVVPEGKKGDVDGLVGIIPAGGRIKGCAHAHSDRRAGFGDPEDRQARAPLVDVVLLGQDVDDRRPGIDHDLFLDLGGVAVPPVAPGTVQDRHPQHSLAVGQPQGGRVDFDLGGLAVDRLQAEPAGGGEVGGGQRDLLAILAQHDRHAAQAAFRVLQAQGELGGFPDVIR